MTKGILDRLSEGVVLGDGGYLLELERRGYVPAGPLEKISLPRAAMGEFARQARDMSFNYIGSCCGSVAAHVREMAKALGKVSPEEREWRATGDRPKSGYELHRMGDG